MKTSFYFVLWIVIYPILGLFHNNFIYHNSFLVALAVVIALSLLIRKLMPNTFAYENATRCYPILEDVYSSNVEGFRKRLATDARVETVAALYFCVTILLIALSILFNDDNGWVDLLIFALLAYTTISRSAKLNKALRNLKSNPTPEECMEIAEETYQLDYASYYEERQSKDYLEVYPPKPRFYSGFRILSMVFACVAVLLGLIFIVLGGVLMFSSPGEFEAQTAGFMYFLYGSLAAYYGVKDFISIIKSFKSK